MGFYIFDSHEVGECGKLERLRQIPGAVELEYTPHNIEWRSNPSAYPVCWVDNAVFEACGIAFDEREFRRFTTGMSGRPFKWFLVPTDELVKLRPHLAEYLRGERDWREV